MYYRDVRSILRQYYYNKCLCILLLGKINHQSIVLVAAVSSMTTIHIRYIIFYPLVLFHLYLHTFFPFFLFFFYIQFSLSVTITLITIGNIILQRERKRERERERERECRHPRWTDLETGVDRFQGT